MIHRHRLRLAAAVLLLLVFCLGADSSGCLGAPDTTSAPSKANVCCPGGQKPYKCPVQVDVANMMQNPGDNGMGDLGGTKCFDPGVTCADDPNAAQSSAISEARLYYMAQGLQVATVQAGVCNAIGAAGSCVPNYRRGPLHPYDLDGGTDDDAGTLGPEYPLDVPGPCTPVTQPPPTCTANAGTCTSSTACCSKLCDPVTTRCATCLANTAPCTFNSDCCSGSCAANVCTNPQSCVQIGNPCTSDADCCSDNCGVNVCI